MSMNKFFVKLANKADNNGKVNYYEIEDYLFEFLWERGAKEFITSNYSEDDREFKGVIKSDGFEVLKEYAKCLDRLNYAQDFLDCVAINEEEVKKGIKEFEK